MTKTKSASSVILDVTKPSPTKRLARVATLLKQNESGVPTQQMAMRINFPLQ
jgi:hypothetical protein